ncbi:hypothetical protein ACFSCX_19495 [Bacillus salitolerans]|uniref:Peptidase A2 domain-containing protein n=1 Tax=Bacillus salitolerans TaxID=1437434 RepID=A0ABW4LU76_9BACI
MEWGLVREQYPDKLVLVEALSTSSKDSVRTVEEMSIISTFDDNMYAWNAYKRVHKENPEKELYVFHTSKEKPEVIEKFFYWRARPKMELRVEDGLLLDKVTLEYQGKKLQLDNVLVDTGCSDSIFDTDLLAKIGLNVDYINGVPTTMYGVGGKGEVCNQQIVTDFYIDGQALNHFHFN